MIDNETDYLDLLSERLRNRGMSVTTAKSRSDALRQIDKQDFDIMVTDPPMPRMDGIETMKRIKTRRPQTETIMFTGHATLKSGIEAVRCGAENYLKKPVVINILLKK